MKKVTVTYHMRNMLRSRSTDETCIDVPVTNELADELVNRVTPILADTEERMLGAIYDSLAAAIRLLDTICDSLALLQGYDEAEIVDIRYANQNEAAR